MRLTKVELAAKLKVSERALTSWQADGMPVLERGGRGKPNVYDVAAVVDWIRRRGHEFNPRNGMMIVDLSRLDCELASLPRPVPAPAPRIAPELLEVERLFRLAAQGEAAFARYEAALRAAMRAVPEARRCEVQLHCGVMDKLIADVFRVVAESEEPGFAPAKLTDAEADQMGKFWYEVAAGEWVVAQGAPGG